MPEHPMKHLLEECRNIRRDHDEDMAGAMWPSTLSMMEERDPILRRLEQLLLKHGPSIPYWTLSTINMSMYEIIYPGELEENWDNG